MPQKLKPTIRLSRRDLDGCKPSVLSDLLGCAEHHEAYAREPLTTLVALAHNFKDKQDLIKLKHSIRDEHLRYAKAIRSILSAN